MLRKLVIGLPIDDERLAALRARFPDLQIVHAPFEAMDAHLDDADAVVSWELTEARLAAAPRLRWVHSFAAGVDSQPFTGLRNRGVLLTNSSGVHAPNIAEHVLALMLSFARGIPTLIRQPPRDDWFELPVRRQIFELGGQTLLLVGLGDIALALAPRARALGMTITGVRRRIDQPAPDGFARIEGIEGLPAALANADHIVISLPLTPATRALFDAQMLAHIRPGAYLYNVGRGAIVDTPALIDALASGRLAGAGLDVTEPEPLPADSPLWEMANVVITAHTAGSTPHLWDRVAAILTANIERFQRGEPLLNLVDLDAGY